MDRQSNLDRYTQPLTGDDGGALRRGPPEALSAAIEDAVPAQTVEKPPMLILGAPPRGGNHLLRGLLDSHPALLLPPDEDYFIRHLSRYPWLRLLGMLVSGEGAPRFYRKLQKGGHLERVAEGVGEELDPVPVRAGSTW